MGAVAGRSTIIQFAAGLPTANPASLTFKSLGMLNSKTFGMEWDTFDTTADSSPDYTRTSLVSFKAVTIECDGTTYDDDIYNQDEFEDMVVSPGAGTNYQPMAWLKMIQTREDGSTVTRTGPFIVSSFNREEPFDDKSSFSFSAASNGSITTVRT
jgi:predicted secreted protein